MNRKIDSFLIAWKNCKDRLPLLLYGARQIGKTYAVKQFASAHFENLVYLNFEENNDLCGLFGAKIDAISVLKNIELYFSRKVDPAKTLIFFDEVQLCERALTSLKYFAEEAPEYAIIASGSLLGVMINRQKFSFPVGKVTILRMRPFDFEEFLWAADQQMLAQAIRSSFSKSEPLPEPIHQKALELADLYLYLGGMPAILNAYFTDRRTPNAAGDFDYADERKSDLINAYVADMAKYAKSTESSRIMGSFNSIPAQLAKENHKFQYKLIQKGASATLFGASLGWLENAGVIIRCPRLDQPVLPLAGNQDLSAFKIYLHDAGLLAHMMGLSPGNLMLPQLDAPARGAVTENFVAAALTNNFNKIYYWEYRSQAEVDFIVQINGQVIPIEVESRENSRSKSLLSYQNRFAPDYSIRISRKNFGYANQIKSVPLYAVFCLKS